MVRLTILLTRTPFSSTYSSTSSGDSSSDGVTGNSTSTGPISGYSLFMVEVVMIRFTIRLTRIPFSSIYSSTSSGVSSPDSATGNLTSTGSVRWPSLLIVVVVMVLLTIRLTRTPFSSTYSSISSGDSSSIPSISGITISRFRVVEVTFSITSSWSRSSFDSGSLGWDGRTKKEMSSEGSLGSSDAGSRSSIHSGSTTSRVSIEGTTSSESR